MSDELNGWPGLGIIVILSLALLPAGCRQDSSKDKIAELTEQIRLHPSNARLYLDRGLLHLTASNRRESINDVDRAIAIDPGLRDAFMARGILFMNEGQPRKASDDFTKCMELGDTNAVFLRGTCRMQLRDYDSAIHDYRSVTISDLPRWAYTADCFVLKGDYKSAINEWRQGNLQLRDSLTLKSQLTKIAVLYQQLGEHGHASLTMDTVCAMFSSPWVEDFEIRGVIQFNLREHEKARADFRRALELGSRSGLPNYYLGVLAFQEGRTAQSLQFLETARKEGFLSFDLLTQDVRESRAAEGAVEVGDLAKFTDSEEMRVTLRKLKGIVEADSRKEEDGDFVRQRIYEISTRPDRREEHRRLFQVEIEAHM